MGSRAQWRMLAGGGVRSGDLSHEACGRWSPDRFVSVARTGQSKSGL